MQLDDAAMNWIDATLDAMTLEQKVGQILLPMGTAASAAPLDIVDWVEKYQFGGVHLFGGKAEEVRATVDAIQARVKVPLLFTGDLDRCGGRAGGTSFQYQMALGAADDENLAYALGRAIATENLAVGYNWTFSPIVDICGHPGYLRQTASVGEDVEQVARMTCAEIRGLQDHGMAACAKHFPGDGFDDLDQHLTTSVNPLEPDPWRATSGLAFQRAIDAGVWTIMNACIAAPKVDREVPDGAAFPTPVVISRYMTTELLREEMGFEGVIVTDALNMGGLAHHLPQPERYARAFEAGNDMLLFVTRIDATAAYLTECFRSGRIPVEQLDASVRRILTLKARLGLHDGSIARRMPAPTPEFYAQSPCRADAQGLIDASITLLRDSDRTVPVAPGSTNRIAHVLFTNRPEEFDAAVFDAALAEAAEGATIEKFLNPDPEGMYDAVATGGFDLVVTSFYYPIQWGWNTSRAHAPTIRGVMSGYYLADPKAKRVFVSFDTPARLYEMGFMDPFLCSYGQCPDAQRTLAAMIFGHKPIRGRTPISVPGVFARGEGLQRD